RRDLAISLKKMGDVQRWLGQTEAALDSYRRSLEIAQRVADADKGNAQAQRDLAVSITKAGHAQLRMADTRTFLGWYLECEFVDNFVQRRLRVEEALASHHRSLEINEKLRFGELKAALDSHRRSLEISEKLADADEGNAQVQRDLLVG